MSMNLNTDFFAAYQFRHQQAKVVYQLPLKKPQQSSTNTPWSMENSHGNESFLPSIKTVQRLDDGYRPYRRNDFANNHLFVAKQKLARVFLDQPTVDVRSTEELVHLFDEHDSKQRNRKVYRRKPSVSDLSTNSLRNRRHCLI